MTFASNPKLHLYPNGLFPQVRGLRSLVSMDDYVRFSEVEDMIREDLEVERMGFFRQGGPPSDWAALEVRSYAINYCMALLREVMEREGILLVRKAK